MASQKAKEKKAVIWKDIVSTENMNIDNLSMADTELEEPMFVGKKFNFEEDDPEHLDPSAPILSFKKMLNNHKKDLVDAALK